MRYISLFGLTALGTVAAWFLALCLCGGKLDFHPSLYFILPFTFSSGVSVWYYQHTESDKNLLKSIALAAMPVILSICCIVVVIVWLFIDEDFFPVQD